MFMGLALCGPVAFLVLCAATNNLYIALYAVVCISGIVASVLGVGQHFMGWSLGVAESISAVIVIGFSVDCAWLMCTWRAAGVGVVPFVSSTTTLLPPQM